MQQPGSVECVPNTGWDERILVFQYGWLVTTFAVISRRYVVLIDTMINAATAQALVNFVQPALDAGRQLLVVNTHADWDHCWGNLVFAGPGATAAAPIIAHRIGRERLLSAAMRAELAEMQQHTPERFNLVRLQPPTLVFNGSLVIDGGDLTFELMHTPGHQPDHVSILIPEIKTVFVGDAAELPLPYVAHWETLPELRASLQRLAALDVQTALYCHARHTHSPGLIRTNIAYFDRLEQCCAAALEQQRTPVQLDETIDVEALAQFPFAAVSGGEDLNDEEQAAYRSMHQRAIRAMFAYLQHQPQQGA